MIFKGVLYLSFLVFFLFNSLNLIAQDSLSSEQLAELEKENVALKEELKRAHFTKVAMEQNAREISFSEKGGIGKSEMTIYLILTSIASSLLTVVVIKLKKVNDKKSHTVFENSTEEIKTLKKLTDRELDVLTQLAKFKSNPEIASSLFISTNTTKTHVASILKKLKANNRQEAVHKATCLKLIPQTNSSKRETKVGLVSVLVILLGGLCLSTIPSQAQSTFINNKTDCSFLIKANILKDESCQLNGEGPLLKVLPQTKINLPRVPENSWIAAYGIEEVKEGKITQAVLIGNVSCNFRALVESHSSCKATIKYQGQSLMIYN